MLTNRINGRYAELPKTDMFPKTSTHCTSIEGDLWPLLGNIFTPQPSKTPWSAQGQFDGRRLTPAQFGHDEDKSDWYGNSSSSSRLWPGGAALDGPWHSKVKFCTSVCKLWSSDLRRYQQWSIPHRAAPRAGFESGSASPFQVVRLPNCLHSSGSNFIFHFSTSS